MNINRKKGVLEKNIKNIVYLRKGVGLRDSNNYVFYL